MGQVGSKHSIIKDVLRYHEVSENRRVTGGLYSHKITKAKTVKITPYPELRTSQMIPRQSLLGRPPLHVTPYIPSTR